MVNKRFDLISFRRICQLMVGEFFCQVLYVCYPFVQSFLGGETLPNLYLQQSISVVRVLLWSLMLSPVAAFSSVNKEFRRARTFLVVEIFCHITEILVMVVFHMDYSVGRIPSRMDPLNVAWIVFTVVALLLPTLTMCSLLNAVVLLLESFGLSLHASGIRRMAQDLLFCIVVAMGLLVSFFVLNARLDPSPLEKPEEAMILGSDYAMAMAIFSLLLLVLFIHSIIWGISLWRLRKAYKATEELTQ